MEERKNFHSSLGYKRIYSGKTFEKCNATMQNLSI